MKRTYWRPPNVSRTALVLVAVLAVVVLIAVESLLVERKQSHFGEKMAAARLAKEAMAEIKSEKKRLGHGVDLQVDPAATGMIGQSVTSVTSNTGYLSAKLTSTNSNFAAVVIHLLAKAGVGEGDVVAVGVSGSFPALNVSTYAALQILKIKPIIITSVSSSEWGANHTDYLWLDMERTLRAKERINFGSVAATYGGIDDLGIGMTKQGRALLDASMDRNGATKLAPTSLSDSVAKRVALYEELAGDATIAAYINVGGGSASVGTHIGKKQFQPGLNTEPPRSAAVPDSVMLRFAKRGVPVIHLSRVKLLAKRFGLPYRPRRAVPIGQGSVFVKKEYNRWLAFGGLILILGAMFAFIRWDIGTRLLPWPRSRTAPKPPEQMV